MTMKDDGWIKPPPGLSPPADAKDMAAAAAALGEVVIKAHGRMELACILMVDKAGFIGEALFDVPDKADELAALIERLTDQMRARGVVRYAFVMEAWIRKVRTRDLETERHIRPSTAPDREDGLVVSAQSETEDLAMLIPFQRDAEGRFLGLGRAVVRRDVGAMMPFGSLLRPVTQH